MAFEREQMRATLAELALRGVYLGTSSWKYPGWCGPLYTRDRYVWRGRFSESRFEKQCLTEYSEVFRSVCVDAAYYRFPRVEYLEGLAAQVSGGFRFSFKVTDEITLKRFTRLPRFGARAGLPNEDFLNAGLFASAFLGPCERIRDHVGLLIFEFSKFYSSDFARGQEFVEVLERFLERLPRGWDYGVEIRNRSFLHPDYFACLARHGVAHVFNSWDSMPPVDEQMGMEGAWTSETLIGARFLLAPGRKYQEAVDRFSPYDRVQEQNPDARAAGAKLIARATAKPGTRAYIYVNNRLEGNALETIKAMVDL